MIDPELRSLSEAESLDPVFRLEELVARCAGRLDFAQRVMAKFLDHFAHDVAGLELAWDTGDFDALAFTAHRMKGAAANIAAPALRTRVTEIEDAARRRQPENLAEIFPRLRDDWERFSDVAAGLGDRAACAPTA